ncbi:MAG: hypothetical protein ABII01_06500 [Candidatus Woesearchaeota archaeon]
MRKKGQGMSVNVIIVAALALLVLVLLALIFTGKITFFRSESGNCENNAGTCKLVCDDASGEVQSRLYTCDDDSDVCCILGDR